MQQTRRGATGRFILYSSMQQTRRGATGRFILYSSMQQTRRGATGRFILWSLVYCKILCLTVLIECVWVFSLYIIIHVEHFLNLVQIFTHLLSFYLFLKITLKILYSKNMPLLQDSLSAFNGFS